MLRDLSKAELQLLQKQTALEFENVEKDLNTYNSLKSTQKNYISTLENVVDSMHKSRQKQLATLSAQAANAAEKQRNAAMAITQRLQKAHVQEAKRKANAAKREKIIDKKRKRHAPPVAAVSFPPMGYSQFENDGEVLSVIIRLAVRYTIQIDTEIKASVLERMLVEYTGMDMQEIGQVMDIQVDSLLEYVSSKPEWFVMHGDSFVVKYDLPVWRPMEKKNGTIWLRGTDVIQHGMLEVNNMKLFKDAFEKVERQDPTKLVLRQAVLSGFRNNDLNGLDYNRDRNRNNAYVFDMDSLLTTRDGGNNVLKKQNFKHPYVVDNTPLLKLQSYKYHPYYTDVHDKKILSSTFVHGIDPQKILCMYELNGVCNDEACTFQHERDYLVSHYDALKIVLPKSGKALHGIGKGESSQIYEHLAKDQLEANFGGEEWKLRADAAAARKSTLLSDTQDNDQLLTTVGKFFGLPSRTSIFPIHLPKELYALVQAKFEQLSHLTMLNVSNDQGLQKSSNHESNDVSNQLTSVDESFIAIPNDEDDVIDDQLDIIHSRYFEKKTGDVNVRTLESKVINGDQSPETYVRLSLELLASMLKLNENLPHVVCDSNVLTPDNSSFFYKYHIKALLSIRKGDLQPNSLNSILNVISNCLNQDENLGNEALWNFYFILYSIHPEENSSEKDLMLRKLLLEMPDSFRFRMELMYTLSQHAEGVNILAKKYNSFVKHHQASPSPSDQACLQMFDLTIFVGQVLYESGNMEQCMEIFDNIATYKIFSHIGLRTNESTQGYTICDEVIVSAWHILIHLKLFGNFPSIGMTSGMDGLAWCSDHIWTKHVLEIFNDQLFEEQLLEIRSLFLSSMNSFSSNWGILEQTIVRNYIAFEVILMNRCDLVIKFYHSHHYRISQIPEVEMDILKYCLQESASKSTAGKIIIRTLRLNSITTRLAYSASVCCAYDTSERLAVYGKKIRSKWIHNIYFAKVDSGESIRSLFKEHVLTLRGNFLRIAGGQLDAGLNGHECFVAAELLYDIFGPDEAIEFLDFVLLQISNSSFIWDFVPIYVRRELWLLRIEYSVRGCEHAVPINGHNFMSTLSSCLNSAAINAKNDHDRLVEMNAEFEFRRESVAGASFVMSERKPPVKFVFETHVWKRALALVNINAHGILYQHLMATVPGLRNCAFIVTDHAEWLLWQGKSSEALSLTTRVLNRIAYDEKLMSIALHLLEKNGAIKHGMQLLERAMAKHKFSSSAWNQLLRMVVLFGGTSSDNQCQAIQLIAQVTDRMCIQLPATYYGDCQFMMENGSISLDRTSLCVFPSNIFASTYAKTVVTLTLSRNYLVYLPESISILSELQRLDVSYNSLVCLPTSIVDLPNLTYLNVAHNQLMSLPSSISKLSKLTELNCNANLIGTVPISMKSLKALHRIHLAYNNLNRIEVSKLQKIFVNCEINTQGNGVVENQAKKRVKVHLHPSLGQCVLCRSTKKTQRFNNLILCPNCIISSLRQQM